MVVQTNNAIEAAAEAERVLASGAPNSLEEGVRALARAAEFGSGQATTRLAHFKAAGVVEKADWDGAVDLLQRAAEVGWSPALEELSVLAGGQGAAPSEMRAHVDIRAWIAPRRTKTVSDSPRIRNMAAFMSPLECAWVVGLGKPRLKPASVYDNDDLGSQMVSARTNTAAPLVLLDIDIVSVFLTARMANSIGLPSQWFEPPTVLHYSPGEQFLPHFDFLDPAIPGQAAELRRGGQRVATLLVYLSDGYEGGETEFPRLSYRFKGQLGDALVFANVTPTGAIDPRTMHAGRPPANGEKWLLSQWIRDRNAQ